MFRTLLTLLTALVAVLFPVVWIKTTAAFPMYAMPVPMPMMPMPMMPTWPGFSSMLPFPSSWQQQQQQQQAFYAPQQASGYPAPIMPQSMSALSGIVQLPSVKSGLEQVAGIQLPFGKPETNVPQSLLSTQAKTSGNTHFDSSAYRTDNIVPNRGGVERLPGNLYGVKPESASASSA